MWKADAQTISLLASFSSTQLVIIDTFDNPVQVNRKELLDKLQDVYTRTMSEWYNEWQDLESKR